MWYFNSYFSPSLWSFFIGQASLSVTCWGRWQVSAVPRKHRRWSTHQHGVKSPLLPENQLSTCQKDPEKPLTEALFRTFVPLLFIYQASLPDTWKTEGLLRIHDGVSAHRIASLSGKNLSDGVIETWKLNVIAEWVFSEGKLDQFHPDSSMDEEIRWI